jgi:hypothetical protein
MIREKMLYIDPSTISRKGTKIKNLPNRGIYYPYSMQKNPPNAIILS